MNSAGSGSSSYGFTGEMTDDTGLIYLRARYMDPTQGRFLTKDLWQGNYSRPLSLNNWVYVEGNPINFTDPAGRYGDQEVHYKITLDLAKKVGKLYCQLKGCLYYYELAKIIASGDRHMDEVGFFAVPGIGRPDVHFSDKPVAYNWTRSAISLREPYLFGAALHSVQDWYSHFNEGYRWPDTLGHAYPTIRAQNRSVEVVGDFFESYPPETVRAMLSASYLSKDINNVSDYDLIDLFLQTFTAPGDSLRVKYGYNTDHFFGFTSRDQSMMADTQKWLIKFYQSYQPDLCSTWEILAGLYTPPTDKEIHSFLDSGNP